VVSFINFLGCPSLPSLSTDEASFASTLSNLWRRASR
jgi:hypothetical protein